MFTNLSNFASMVASNFATNIATNINQNINNNTTANNKAPPASHKVLSSLPMVKVTSDDILEVTNKECLICLDEQKVGSWSCKLQCGHLFHKQCVLEWLEKHCTCPVCRFELETDDASYEFERKKRMKKRKLRLRSDEIKNKSISQLRELCSSLNININDCLYKTEIVDRLIKSGLIDVTEGSPPVEFTEDEFNSKSVSELRYLLLSFGITDRDALEKSDLRSRLIESSKIIINKASNDLVTSSSNSSSSKDTIDNEKIGSINHDINMKDKTVNISTIDRISLRDKLKNMELSDLRHLCHKYNINISNCVDKSEVIEYLMESSIITNMNNINNELDYYNNNVKPRDDDSKDYTFINKPIGDYYYNDDDYIFNKTQNERYSNDGIFEENQTTNDNILNDKSSTNINIHYNNNNNINNNNNNNNTYIFGSLKNNSDLSIKKYTYQDEDADIDISINDASTIHNNNSTINNYRKNYSYYNNNYYLDTYINAYDDLNNAKSTTNSSSSNSINNNSNIHSTTNDNHEKLSLSIELLQEMSIKEIKNIMVAYKIETIGCLEKSDMINRMKLSNLIDIIS